jgi:S1-C subfamily serine protease
MSLTGSWVRTVVDAAGPAVVGLRGRRAGASGVVFDDGRVLTTAHGLGEGEVEVVLADGRATTGRLVAADRDADLAVVAVDTGGAAAPAWADAAPVPGDAVVALANPGGRGPRVSVGIASAVDQTVRGPHGSGLRGLEHTAPLPPGASGGPLLDAEGRMVGLNVQRRAGGLILALAADADLRRRAEALARGEAPRTVRLGVRLLPPRAARRLREAVGLPERAGLLVRDVEPASPAARSGLGRGDLLVGAAGRPVERLSDLRSALETAPDAGPLELTVVRGNEERRVAVALDPR